MGRPAIIPPANLIRPVSWTITVGTLDSADPNYGVTALNDGKMSRPLKVRSALTGTTPAVGVRLTADFGTAVPIIGLAVPNSGFGSKSAQVSLNATNVWTAPTVTETLIWSARHGDGHSCSPFVDFRNNPSYGAGSYRYLSVFVSESILGTLQQWGEILIFNAWNVTLGYDQFEGNAGTGRRRLITDILTTEYGMRRGLRRDIKVRTLRTRFRNALASSAFMTNLMDQAGGNATPFLVLTDELVPGDGALYGRFPKEFARDFEQKEFWFLYYDFPFEFEEDSRGIPFTGV
jgi:hypothetical protein